MALFTGPAYYRQRLVKNGAHRKLTRAVSRLFILRIRATLRRSLGADVCRGLKTRRRGRYGKNTLTFGLFTRRIIYHIIGANRCEYSDSA